MAARRLWTVLVGAWMGAFLARAVLDWLLGFDGVWVGAAILAAAVAGGAASIGEARELRPIPAHERRDSFIGWTALTGGVIAVACLFLPLPWGVIAAAVVVALTLLGLQRIPPLAPEASTASRDG